MCIRDRSYNSHVAIVARALNIPVVGGIRYLFSQIEEGAPVVVDGDSGVVVIRPGADFQSRIEESIATHAQHRRELLATRDLDAVTEDGVQISLMINAGLLMDFEHIEAEGADGVGLLRTELTFMLHPEFPNFSEPVSYTHLTLPTKA